MAESPMARMEALEAKVAEQERLIAALTVLVGEIQQPEQIAALQTAISSTTDVIAKITISFGVQQDILEIVQRELATFKRWREIHMRQFHDSATGTLRPGGQ